METFEFHITGEGPHIHFAAEKLGLRTIEIDLLTPKGEVIRSEHMTSHVGKFPNLKHALEALNNYRFWLTAQGVKILRMKLESPIYNHYVDRSLYMETHFKDKSFTWPTSKTKHSQKLVATSRIYSKKDYGAFEKVHKPQGHELELCLYDSNSNEDKDWLDLWRWS
jgi:hypothetical protein